MEIIQLPKKKKIQLLMFINVISRSSTILFQNVCAYGNFPTQTTLFSFLVSCLLIQQCVHRTQVQILFKNIKLSSVCVLLVMFSFFPPHIFLQPVTVFWCLTVIIIKDTVFSALLFVALSHVLQHPCTQHAGNMKYN